MTSVEKRDEKIPFEDALNKTGFGLYSIMVIFICGLNHISFVCMAFSATVIVPASACDLETTTAQQGAMVAAPYIGFGLYSIMVIFICGLNHISFVCMAFSATVIVPASACDLETTTAQQGAMVAAPYIGNVFGGIVWGYISDLKGRRKVLMISLASAACVNAIGSLSVNWIMLMAFQFVSLVLASGQYTIVMAYACESIPKYRRNMVILLVFSIYLIGQGVMSVLGIPILPSTYAIYLSGLGIYWTSWRTLMVVYSVPSLLTLFFLLFMRESPKFVLGKGDEEDAMDILRTIHGINKGKSNEYEVTGILLELDSTEPKTSVKKQLVPLFKQPLLKPILIMTLLFILFQAAGVFMQWLPTISNQFFQTLQTGDVAGLNLCGMISAGYVTPPDENTVPCAIDENALLVVLVVCVMQSGLNAVFSLVIQYTGRRNLTIAAVTVFGCCGIMVNVIPNAIVSAVFFILFLMSILVMGIYMAMALALFPTHVRAVAVSLIVTGGQLASFAAIQVINYFLVNSCELGFYLFSALFTVSAGFLFLLPDDRLQTKQELEKQKDEELIS